MQRMNLKRAATRSPKETTLSFRCPLTLAKKMRHEAEKDGRTVSNWLRVQVERRLNAG